MKHNNMLPNQHFRKDWQFRVRVALNQAKRKEKRRAVRQAKAKAAAPRPVSQLRPQVHAPTQRYNAKVRLGRGFTKEEIKAAGMKVAEARGLGIAVDFRRRNKSQESLTLNKARLEAYRARIAMNPKTAVAGAVTTGVVSRVSKPSGEVKLATITDAMRKVEQVRRAKQAVATFRLEGARRFKKDEEEKKDDKAAGGEVAEE